MYHAARLAQTGSIDPGRPGGPGTGSTQHAGRGAGRYALNAKRRVSPARGHPSFGRGVPARPAGAPAAPGRVSNTQTHSP
jgi:hypothetical protein